MACHWLDYMITTQTVQCRYPLCSNSNVLAQAPYQPEQLIQKLKYPNENFWHEIAIIYKFNPY